MNVDCPCCGFLTLTGRARHEVCRVCFWEDDLSQLRWPWSWGANAMCLVDAQVNYQRFGAMEERFLKNVRLPASNEPLDPGWRPIDPSRDSFCEPGSGDDWPEDLTLLYWWRASYWKADERPAAPPSAPQD